ncbi:hypothetical protein [Nitrospira sp. Nam80]
MNTYSFGIQRVLLILVAAISYEFFQQAWCSAEGQGKDRSFNAVITDSQGIESEVKNVLFYWEEKVSETAFVPHELRDVPVKKGAATIKVRFDQIRQIDIKPAPDSGSSPALVISLASGKTGEFSLAINGSFKGLSDFGEAEFPANGLRRIVLK